MKKQEKRINLGSGTDYIPGWVNVDIDSAVKKDVVADLTKSFPFENNSAVEIKASDILEHFTKESGELFLRECHRVLSVDGIITIRTHNVFQIIKQFKNDPEVMLHFLYGDTKQTGIFGAHKYGYTRESLTVLLRRIGFEVLKIEEEETNFLVIAKKTRKIEEPLTIGIIQQTPDVGGAETYMHNLVKEFTVTGNKVIIFSNHQPFLELFADLPIIRKTIPFIIDIAGDYKGFIKTIVLSSRAFMYYFNVLRFMKKNGVDVILMSGFTEKLLVTWLAKRFKIAIVWIEYGGLEILLKRNLYIPKIVYRLLKEYPKKVIVPSKNSLKNLIPTARISLAKIVLIPCGIPIRQKTVRKREVLLHGWDKKYIIGSVSRLTREKGQQYLIRAIPNVVKKIPDVGFVIIGTGPDKAYFEELVTQLSLQDHCRIVGFVDDTYSYYELMDIFVFPTVWDMEGFGLVVPEAMSHGLPVIGSDMGPVKEVIDDGKTGILVSPADEEKLANTIITLLENKKMREELGESAYQKAKTVYNITHVAKQVLDALREAAYMQKYE